MRVSHEDIEPVYDARSRILILGTMPSPKSREAGFYYMHPNNRFWKVLSAVFNTQIGGGIEEKIAFCLANRIALWDVIKECDIEGASDSTIKNCVINDFDRIFDAADIKANFTLGKRAYELYGKYTGRSSICLPSTSPANCAVKMEKIIEEFRILTNYLQL